jgi:flagellar basal-body rod protein FlgB
MELSSLTLFRMSRQKMDWLGDRQVVLAQNIANSDTPNYRSQDLRALDFRREVQNSLHLPIRQTSVGHIEGTVRQGEHRVEAERERDLYETNPNQNGVVMEEQLMSVQETNMQYQLATNIYQKNLQMFKTALGRGGNGG